MSAISREALAKVRARIAERCEGRDFAGLGDRRQHTTIARGPDRRAEPLLIEDVPLLDDDDTDYYALSNGLSTVMSDGTRIEGDMVDAA